MYKTASTTILQAAEGTCSVALFHYLTKIAKQTRNDKKETLQSKEIFRKHNFYLEPSGIGTARTLLLI